LKKILVYYPYAKSEIHFETALELIQVHQDQGDEVHFIGCNADLIACDVNMEHDISECWKCISRRKRGLQLLSLPPRILSIFNLKEADRLEIVQSVQSPTDFNNLKDLDVDGFDVGYGILSSLISFARNPNPGLAGNREFIDRMLVSSLAIFMSMRNYLVSEEYDYVYIYNGRYAPMRAAMRACEREKVRFFNFERGSTLKRYSLFENTLPHDIEYTFNEILRVWNSAVDPEQREQIGAQFYMEREQGVFQTWHSFVTQQRSGLLPDGWAADKRNVTIFVSSEDEFEAIGTAWKNPIYRDQMDGIKQIIEAFQDDEYIVLHLRVHPNLSGIRNQQTEFFSNLNEGKLRVIFPEDPVSSYALLKNSDKVITFGSTMGIEACFWGIPSILAGRSFYRDLGATYNPVDHQQLVEMVRDDLEPKDRTAALKYGYYMKTFGIDFIHYKPEKLYHGRFMGTYIKSDFLLRVFSKLLKIWPLRLITARLSRSSMVSGRTSLLTQKVK